MSKKLSIFNLRQMWFWNKKRTIVESGILSGITDYHSHILPGVDDGVESMEEALRILAAYEEIGIKELWLTPHIMEDIPNTPEKLQARFAELRGAYKGNIVLHLAAEYMIDNNLHKLLNNLNCPSLQRGTSNAESIEEGVRNLLPIGTKGNHLLVETSYFSSPIRLHETLKQIKAIGFYPILAHPERYIYMETDDYLELKEEDVKFQLNILSLGGYYGNTAKKKAEWMLKKGFYNIIGSDLHHEDAIELITGCKLNEKKIALVNKLIHTDI